MATTPNEKPRSVNGRPAYCSIRDFVALTGLGRSTIYREAGKSLPPLHRLAATRRFRWDEIEAWQEAGEIWPPTPPGGRRA
jgi:predicted DNA-binding transcriptional regulator AlpA